MAKKKDDKTIIKEKQKKKVIEINKSNVVPALEELLNMAKEGKLTNFIMAGYSNDDEIVTTLCDCTLVENITLVGYLQQINTLRMLDESLLDFEE